MPLTLLQPFNLANSATYAFGNVTASGTISATGNITGGNVIATTLVQGTTVSASGNVVGGNITTAGLITATGNISGGNLNITGNIVDTGDLTITSTAANATIFLTPTGTGTVRVAKDITNGQANGTGNIGSATGYFNTVFAKATSAQYADLAESYLGDNNYEPGTVTVFGGSAEVTVSTKFSDPAIAGVVSTEPAYLMNATISGENVLNIALVGRVPCKVVGKISKGDRLVSSDIPGVATVINPDCAVPGVLIGKALQNYDSDIPGVIEVAVGRS